MLIKLLKNLVEIVSVVTFTLLEVIIICMLVKEKFINNELFQKCSFGGKYGKTGYQG